MDKYIKCPRCEINYILEKQKYCDICKAELKLAPDIYSEDDEEMVLCPVCKTNYIFPDEEMCSSCKAESQEIIEKEPDIESDEDWRTFLDDEKDLPVVVGEDDEEMEEVSLNELRDEEMDKDYDDEDDFDFGSDFDYDDDFSDEEDEDDEEDDD